MTTPTTVAAAAKCPVNLPITPPSEADRAQEQVTGSVSTGSPDTLNDLHQDNPPETKERRLLEARLMHHYLNKTAQTLTADPSKQAVFSTLIPELCFKSDALLYSMYSIAALQAAVSGEDIAPNIVDIHRRYFSMALREHNQAVSHITHVNADAVLWTSSLMRLHTFAILKDRSRQPYHPPIEWLTMIGTATAVYQKAFLAVGEYPKSNSWQVFMSNPIIYDMEERYGKSKRKGLEHLLVRSPNISASEHWNPDIQDAYEGTLSYIGGIHNIMDANILGQEIEIRKRLVVFPMMAKGLFVELVRARQPRALVVLAHYFALLHMHGRHEWWIGHAGVEEIRAIADQLSGTPWTDLLEWPLQVSEARL